MTENAEGLKDIGKLVLAFAKVNRATAHEDGLRPESDTDHTVMLSVSACALASKLYRDELDLGLVAQCAIVHDLVEAYALDTDSFNLKEDARKEKEEREHRAFLRIQNEFSTTFPWLPEMIEKYEALDTREARFVKVVDKAMTKVTHLLNDSAVFKRRGDSREAILRHFEMQLTKCEHEYAFDFPEVLALLKELGDEIVAGVSDSTST